MLQFLVPVFLIGLVGIILPILVHLWNTKDSRIIKVGSIRWLQESESVKVSRFRLSEIPLLLLRVLIIVILVLLLAGARSSMFMTKSETMNWVLIDPSISDLSKIQTLINEKAARNWQVRYLQSAFPLIDEPVDFLENQNYWELLKDLDISERRIDSLQVFSRSNSINFSGKKPTLGFEVDWVTVPEITENQQPGLALSIADSLLIYYASTENRNIVLHQSLNTHEILEEEGVSFAQFSGSSQPELEVVNLDTLQVSIYGKPDSDEFKNLVAALQAISEMSIRPITINANTGNAVVFNLADTIVYGNSSTFTLALDEQSSAMLLPDLRVIDRYLITKELRIDLMMKNDFVKSLAATISQDYQKIIKENITLELPLSSVMPQFDQQTNLPDSSYRANLTSPLWFLLIILLSIERFISYRGKQ